MKFAFVLCIALFSFHVQAGKIPSSSDYARIRVLASDLKLHDGDTVRYIFKAEDGLVIDGKPLTGSRSLRLVGYDTPELAAPGIGMLFDQPLGQEAADYARALVSKKGSTIYLHVISQTGDKGRLLAEIEVDGEFLGEALVREGLAYETVSAFPIESAFPATLRERLRAAILAGWFESPLFKAMEEGKRLRLLNPYVWRKINMHSGMTYNAAQWEALSAGEKQEVIRRACDNSANNAVTQLPRHENRLSDDSNERNFVLWNGQRRRVRFASDLSQTDYANEACR